MRSVTSVFSLPVYDLRVEVNVEVYCDEVYCDEVYCVVVNVLGVCSA